jgi:hypothetical protein
LKIKAVSISNRITAILELGWSTGLGTFRDNWPVLALGGSKVNIKGNFKGKGKCAGRVVSQNSGGFVKKTFFPWQGEELHAHSRVNPKAAQCTNMVCCKKKLYNTHIHIQKQKNKCCYF